MKMWARSIPGRLVTLAVVAILLVVAAIQVANRHSYVSEVIARIGETGSGPDANLSDLTSINQLQANFNRDSGRPRLILLLSPT